jgi:hypothetical protein
MRNILLLILSTLLSFCASSANAGDHPAFSVMPKQYLNSSGKFVEVHGLLWVRNQGGLPVCDGIVAWYLLMQYQCKQAGADCTHLDPSATPAPLLFASLGARSAYSNRYGRSTVLYSEGAGTYGVLEEMSSTGKVLADSCFDYEGLVNLKYRGDQVRMAEAFERLNTEYFDAFKSSGAICIDCLQRVLKQDFNIAVDEAIVERALKEKIFDQFLYDVMYGQCRIKAKIPYAFAQHGWPGERESVTYDIFLKTLLEQLEANTPVAVGACLDEKPPTDHCKSAHGMVVAGYRKVCAGNSCTDFIRIHNSWGKDWRSRNSDGWIDARNFYEYMQKSVNFMTWIGPVQ